MRGSLCWDLVITTVSTGSALSPSGGAIDWVMLLASGRSLCAFAELIKNSCFSLFITIAACLPWLVRYNDAISCGVPESSISPAMSGAQIRLRATVCGQGDVYSHFLIVREAVRSGDVDVLYRSA